MHKIGVALTIVDRNEMNLVTAMGPLAERWLHCKVLGMSFSRCVSPEANTLFISSYQEVDYERVLRDLIPSYSKRDVP